MEEKVIQTSGFHTTYIETGTPGKTPLVLVHDGAFGASGAVSWGRFIPLVEGEYHVFAPDLLGWGGSDKAVFFDRAPYAPRVAQLQSFCEQLGIRDAIFMGVSFGASVLLRWATSAVSPPPAQAIIAINGTGGPMRKPEGLEALGSFDPPSMGRLRDLCLWLLDDHEGLEQHLEERFEAAMVPGQWESMMAVRVRNPEAPPVPVDTFFDDLSRVTAPVVYVEGTRDKMLEPGWSEVLKNHTPGSTSVTMNSSHEPNIDNPELLLEVFRTLVNKK